MNSHAMILPLEARDAQLNSHQLQHSEHRPACKPNPLPAAQLTSRPCQLISHLVAALCEPRLVLPIKSAIRHVSRHVRHLQPNTLVQGSLLGWKLGGGVWVCKGRR